MRRPAWPASPTWATCTCSRCLACGPRYTTPVSGRRTSAASRPVSSRATARVRGRLPGADSLSGPGRGSQGGHGTGQQRLGRRLLGGAVVGVPPLTVPRSLPAHPGFYLISPSEFERFSLSARNITEPLCSLDISWPRDSTRARCVEGPTQEACPRGQSHPCAELCTERGWPSVVAPLSDPGA